MNKPVEQTVPLGARTHSSFSYKFNVVEVLNRPYSRKLTPEPSGGFLATIHEFPGCIADGESPAAAYANLNRAAASWIEAAGESGYPIPEPANYDGASGKIALRISRRLHKSAAERADIEGVSLNQLISVALSSYLGQIDGVVRCIRTLKSDISTMVDNLVTLHEVTNVMTQEQGKIDLHEPLQMSQVWRSHPAGKAPGNLAAVSYER